MTKFPPRPTLLPEDITKREAAHAQVDGRLDDIDTGLPVRAKASATAPAEYLPALAWERSVDVYEPAWPEEVRRAVIEAAPIVHRYKGTRYAVQTALAALRIETEITEWWQEAPRGVPYTFRVTARVRGRLYDGPILDERLIRDINGAVMAAKPESRAYSLQIAVSWSPLLGLAPVLAAKVRFGRAVVPRSEPDMGAGLGLAPVLVPRVRFGRAVVPRSETDMGADLGLAPVLAAKVRLACAVVPVLPD